jgi:acetylornithine/succinyldiaminopimelate/putrescine aminotransferase
MLPAALELVDSELYGSIARLGLDVEYVRARGNTMWARCADGTVRSVLDLVGGYGSLILGHNHPELVAGAKRLLDNGVPVHAQLSRRPEAAELAERLNRVIGREFGTDERYHAVLANSGAEAIEAAVKHAEFDRVARVDELTTRLRENADAARAAVADGRVRVPDSVLAALGLPVPAADPAAALDAVLAELGARNAARLAAPPCVVALVGGFHGKLVATTQLTHNVKFRTPFAALGLPARFAPVNDPAALRQVFEDERSTVLDVALVGGELALVERDFPGCCALVVEAVQGEGGIVALTAEFAKEAQAVCAEFGCPLIVDEIQSGVGRTGAFFASSHLGLQADYFTLAKSLGGGLAKISVLLVRASRYRPRFELLHSSTFAKDPFATSIALRVLDLLEADDGAAYAAAAGRGTRLAEALSSVRTDFPDVVRDVRGSGLFLGFEFQDLSGAGSKTVAQVQPAGLFGYFVSGFLLHEHDIRVLPTGSAPNTLRIQPSIDITDEEIGRVAAALRHLCSVLRDGDDAALTAFLGNRRF